MNCASDVYCEGMFKWRIFMSWSTHTSLTWLSLHVRYNYMPSSYLVHLETAETTLTVTILQRLLANELRNVFEELPLLWMWHIYPVISEKKTQPRYSVPAKTKRSHTGNSSFFKSHNYSLLVMIVLYSSTCNSGDWCLVKFTCSCKYHKLNIYLQDQCLLNKSRSPTYQARFMLTKKCISSLWYT